MKYFISFMVILALSICATGQELCQGGYYTEQVGAEKLNDVLNRLHSLKDWKDHSDSIKSQLRRGMGLERPLRKTPLNPATRNKKILDGYSVESVAFESIPGFFVTGNLYRPTGNFGNKSLAVVLCTHGHSNQPESGGRFSQNMQLRCAALARMGALVFAYDMVGYGESNQLPHKNEKALLVQTWNSIRVLDYLLTFEEADPERVAVTGESGGGTQAFMLTALDERIKVSVPVVMVSAHFFGGCACESGMPVHKTGNAVFSNAQIACLAAPRPMLLVSDGADWTKNTPRIEYPFAQQVYQLYGQGHHVENAHFEKEGHNYGESKRLASYDFLAKHLGLKIQNIQDKQGKVSEAFAVPLQRAELIYFDNDHPSILATEDVYRAMVNLQSDK
jgi:uncharacterized protein